MYKQAIFDQENTLYKYKRDYQGNFMGTLQVLKTGFSTIWKGVKGKCMRTKTPKLFAESKNITVSNDLPLVDLPLDDLPLDEFVRTTPKPPRPITTADKYNFRQYILGKKLDLKITQQEIKELFAHEGEEFKVKSFEFLCKKMNVPQSLKPDLLYGAEIQARMYYDYLMNKIYINPNFTEQLADKTTFLSVLRHEMQHCAQNMAMFRHETEGEKLIDLYAKMSAKSVHINVDKYVKTLDTEQLKQIFDEEGMKDITILKDLLKNNKTAEYEQYLARIEDEIYQKYIPIFTDFRKSIIDKMGILKKETVEGERASKMIDVTTSELQYWKQDGSADLGMYLNDIREVEALTAQDMITQQLNAITSGNNKYCYLKNLREAQENMEKNIDTLDPQLQELLIKSKENIDEESVKQVMTYIFD